MSSFSHSGANSQPSSFIKRFYSSRDYLNRCSPIMSHMVSFSVEQVLCQLIRITLDGIYIVVQIYHVRMYGPPVCSRCTYLCLSILLCICPVQLDYEVAFTIRSTNGFFLPKQAVVHVGQTSVCLILHIKQH